MQDGFKPKPEVINQIPVATTIEIVNFVSDAKRALKTINQIVNDTTRGYIPAILRKGSVNRSTRMIIGNAILFKGIWETEFNEKLTETMESRGFDNIPSVDMIMRRDVELRYSDNNPIPNAQVRD